MIRVTVFVAIGLGAGVLGSGCSAGSGTSPSPVGTTAAETAPARYAIAPDANARRPATGPFTAIILSRPLFPDPEHGSTTATLLSQTTGAVQSGVRWSVSNANVAIPATSADFSPTPPPNGIVLVGTSFGTATVTATTTDGTATMPIFYYPAIETGCDFRASAAATFDPPSPVALPSAAPDLYVTGPVMNPALNPCVPAGYVDAGAADFTLHVPYGATLATDGNSSLLPVATGAQRAPEFPFIPGSMWRHDFTSLSFSALGASLDACGATAPCAVSPGNVLLLKTAAGRIVKFRIDGTIDSVVGHYEVSDLAGNFPY